MSDHRAQSTSDKGVRDALTKAVGRKGPGVVQRGSESGVGERCMKSRQGGVGKGIQREGKPRAGM